MSSSAGQQLTDSRNLIISLIGLVIVLLFLAVLIERVVLPSHPRVGEAQSPQNLEKKTVRVKTPVIPKTTVRILPLVTKFPPLPDFNAYTEVEQRKAAFIDYLTPIVEYQNEKILKDREHLENISKLLVNDGHLLRGDEQWLKQLADKYKVTWQDDDLGIVVFKLAGRVDIIPVSLALVQAAKESSWGRSRYAVQANNLFGQWCYDVGCGLVPGERPPDAVHEVRRYKSVNDSTRSYIHNLNTHPQYEMLRLIRQQLRLFHRPITGSALANGLLYYSQRRHAYVEEVKSMIRQYHLFQDRRTG